MSKLSVQLYSVRDAFAHDPADTLARLAADAAAGRIRVPVTVTYTLDEVPRAFEEFRSGTRGKICIQVAPAREEA